MKLFFSPGACSLAAHISLQEAGLPYGLARVDLRAHEVEGGQSYYAINPKGYVPALQLDDGAVLTENPAILQYVADQAPQKGLAPAAGTIERYRLQEWLGFIGTEIHKAFSPLFNPACTEETRQAQHARLSMRLEYVAKSLEGRQYLMGERFTVADAYLYAVINWTAKVGPDLKQWPALLAYKERIEGRPGVQAARVAEGLRAA